MRFCFSRLDVTLGLRMLTRHPALTLVGGLGLAVAVALSVGFFTFMRAWIYPVLPLEEGHRIVALENRDIDADDEERRSLHDFFTWREELRTIRDVGAFRHVLRNVALPGGPPEPVNVAEMTAAGFRVARVPPLLGRYLLEADEAPGAPAVIVIGYDVWQHRFAGATDIIGRELRLGGVPHTVVGVMPEGFAFPESDRFWTPLQARPTSFARRAGPAIYIFGRLAPGVSLEQAQAELATVGQRAAAAYPESNAQLRPMVMPYTHSLTDVQGISMLEVAQMQFMMTLLLLVVALNVGVLVYARTAARQRELAVRSALGASRGRIVAQLFAEALVLALLAAAVGLGIAHAGIAIADGIMSSEMTAGRPFWTDYGIRLETVLVTGALAVLTAVITGVLPGLRATRVALQQDLRQSGGNTPALGRTWTFLILAQVAVAVAALPAAVATGWVEVERAGSRPTFPAEEFIVAAVSPDPYAPAAPAGADGAEAFGLQLEELMRRLQAEPDVAGVTFHAALPDRTERIRVEDVPAPAASPGGHAVNATGAAVDMLDVFGLPVLAGRGFVAADAAEHGSVVIVNEAFVQQILGGATPLGRRIRHVPAEGDDDPAAHRWFEIVGVARNAVSNPSSALPVTPAVLYPVGPGQARAANIAVRVRPGVAVTDVATQLRVHAAAVDPTLRLGAVRALAQGDTQQRLVARLISLAVMLVLASVLLLSAAGIYALMSFTVTSRRREIGIRSALGAPPREVLHSVCARAAAQVGAGVVVGVLMALALDVLAGGGTLYGRGAIIVPALALLMAVTGIIAAWGPARRGLRIQPTEALRSDL